MFWIDLRTFGVSASSTMSRSTIPRVCVEGRTPPLGIGVPVPGFSATKRLATPVRLSWPIEASVPLRIGVIDESEIESSMSASPSLASLIAPTEPMWWPASVTRSPRTSCPASLKRA